MAGLYDYRSPYNDNSGFDMLSRKEIENDIAHSLANIAESLHKLANPLMKINADTGEVTIVKEDQPT